MRMPLLSLVLVCACAAPAARAPAEPQVAAPPSSTSHRIIETPGLSACLRAEGLDGVLAVLEGGSEEIQCSHVFACDTPSPPASTFKIVSGLIALEAGVAEDAELRISWDGVTRDIVSWNQDHTLRTAFDASAVPYYQELARRIGLPGMRDALRRFGYGNADTGEIVDRFWLDGPLAISPVEQLAFLEKLETGALPVSERARAIVREVMIREQRGASVLRGKTGWASPHTADERGWFVGYATRGERTTYVAVRVTRSEGVSNAQFMAGRMRAAVCALEALGAY